MATTENVRSKTFQTLGFQSVNNCFASVSEIKKNKICSLMCSFKYNCEMYLPKTFITKIRVAIKIFFAAIAISRMFRCHAMLLVTLS